MRSRNLKTGLFKNELLGTADPLLTILFEGLWCLADREGRLEDRPLRIKAEIFPYRGNVDVDAALGQLAEMGFIQRYEVDGVAAIQVINFSRHQSPHPKEAASTLPSCSREKVVSSRVKVVASRERVVSSPSDVLNPDVLNPDSGETPPPLKEVLVLKTARARESSPTYSQTDFDDRDRRKLADAFKEINLQLRARVGSDSSPPSEKEIVEWACDMAGISVERGLEVQERGKKWPQTQAIGEASA